MPSHRISLVGGSAGSVVLEPGIEAGQIKLTVDEMVECVLEGAREQLPLQVNGNESGAGVDVLVEGQGVSLHS